MTSLGASIGKKQNYEGCSKTGHKTLLGGGSVAEFRFEIGPLLEATLGGAL
jgi:hypothetical protein